MSEQTVPAVLYAAKSTQDKHKSIPTQLDDCRQMAAREAWEVVGEFYDEGFSAYSGNRGPGLERAKRAAEEAAEERGAPCMLVVQHSDRLARGAGDKPGAADSLGEIWHAMRRADVHLRSVQNDPMLDDALLVAAASKMAFEESKRKSEAVKAGKRRRVQERREPNGPPPFGYRYRDPDARVKERVPDPEEASAFRHIVGMLHEGKRYGEMARWLNSNGFRSKQGKTFSAQRMRYMLQNPYYAGKVQMEEELFDGKHEPLITWEEHEEIQAKLAAAKQTTASRGGRKPKQPTLLSGGLMLCAHCGRGIWQRKHASGRRQYMCANVRQKTGTCDAEPFDAPTTERAVVDHLDGLFVDLGAWIERIADQRAEGRRALESEAAAFMKQRDLLERDEALVNGDYMKRLRAGEEGAATVAATQIERIKSEIAELDEKLRDVQARMQEADGEDAADEVLDWWSEFSEAIRGDVVNAESVAEANAALKERFAAIFVRSEGGVPRLDFVLRERPPGSPVVSSHLWVDEEPPDDWPTFLDVSGGGQANHDDSHWSPRSR